MSIDAVKWFVGFSKQSAADMVQTLVEDGSCADIIRRAGELLVAATGPGSGAATEPTCARCSLVEADCDCPLGGYYTPWPSRLAAPAAAPAAEPTAILAEMVAANESCAKCGFRRMDHIGKLSVCPGGGIFAGRAAPQTDHRAAPADEMTAKRLANTDGSYMEEFLANPRNRRVFNEEVAKEEANQAATPPSGSHPGAAEAKCGCAPGDCAIEGGATTDAMVGSRCRLYLNLVITPAPAPAKAPRGTR